MYVFGAGCLVRLCDSDFGIAPVDAITIGITCAAFCFHIAHISFAIIIIIIIIIIVVELLCFPVLPAFVFMVLQSTLLTILISPI